MGRRCKPGQRARLISGNSNRGAIVLVVRHYFGEEVDGRPWVQELFPWVVASLGRPLRWIEHGGPNSGHSMVIVCDDSELEPIKDDDEDDSTSTSRDKPVTLSTLIL